MRMRKLYFNIFGGINRIVLQILYPLDLSLRWSVEFSIVFYK